MKLNQLNSSIFCLLFSLIIVACNSSQKTYYDTGELKEIIEVNKEGMKHGKYKRFSITGNLSETSGFVNGNQHGIRTLYFESGTIESESKFENGKMDGYHRVNYPSGKLMIDAIYANNELNGTFKKFFENGTINEIVTFKNGEENGPFEEYYLNGKIKWKGSYRNGDHEFGVLEHFSENGELLKKMECDTQFICRTLWKKEGFEDQKQQ